MIELCAMLQRITLRKMIRMNGGDGWCLRMPDRKAIMAQQEKLRLARIQSKTRRQNLTIQ